MAAFWPTTGGCDSAARACRSYPSATASRARMPRASPCALRGGALNGVALGRRGGAARLWRGRGFARVARRRGPGSGARGCEVVAARLVVLGGSGAGTPALVEALVQRLGALPRPPALELMLHGRDAEKLALVEAAARARAAGQDWLRIGASSRRQEALEGATLVLNQVRVGGLRARSFDESFPRALGLPGEETLGPGGFANACRTLPVALELLGDVARFAPEATTINLTNPAAMVQQAAERYLGLRVISVCDSPLSLIRALRQVAEAPAGVAEYLGMNHCGWVVSLRRDGEERLPALLERVEEIPGLGIEPRLVRELGAVPGPYLRYYYHPDRMLAAQQGKPTRAEALLALEAELL